MRERQCLAGIWNAFSPFTAGNYLDEIFLLASIGDKDEFFICLCPQITILPMNATWGYYSLSCRNETSTKQSMFERAMF